MRIMPIMNNQISYKGTMIFENDVLTSRAGEKGVRHANFANIDPKKIESITSADNIVYLAKENMKGYQTVIRMDSGDFFYVKPDPKTVAELKDSANKPEHAKKNYLFNGDNYHWDDRSLGTIFNQKL